MHLLQQLPSCRRVTTPLGCIFVHASQIYRLHLNHWAHLQHISWVMSKTLGWRSNGIRSTVQYFFHSGSRNTWTGKVFSCTRAPSLPSPPLWLPVLGAPRLGEGCSFFQRRGKQSTERSPAAGLICLSSGFFLCVKEGWY